MLKRTITGAVVTAVVFILLYYSYIYEVILCATAVLCAFAVYEIYHAAGIAGNEVLLTLSFVASTLVVLGDIPYYMEIITVIFAISVITFILLMLLQKQLKLNSPIIAFYLALLVVLMIRSVPELRAMENGVYYLSGAVTICLITDLAAYLFGKAFGKHKLAPKISPNKTIEGALAGVISSAVVILLVALLLDYAGGLKVDYAKLSIYAVMASFVGEFGDLAMSSIKRICKVKDFGNLLPGHGGILDRFDSQIFAVPFTLVYCYIAGGFIS